MPLYVINFKEFKDFSKGLNISANISSVQVKPYQTIIITQNQFDAIKKAEVPYGNGYGKPKQENGLEKTINNCS